MTKHPFGKTGLSVSALGFGAAPIGYLKTDAERVARILGFLLDRGMNLIDTAASYEGSEELIGNAVGKRRDEYVLVSKCGQSLPGLGGASWSARVIGEAIDRSLKRLKTDRIDVVLLHSCELETLRAGEAVGALAAARDAGKIRFAGYSGDNEAAEYAASLPDIAVLETSVNVADQANLERVLPAARKRGLGVLAKRPIANAAWKDPASQPGIYANYSKKYTQRLAAMKLNPAGLGFAGPADQAWPELALRFTLSHEGVHCAIIGTTSPENAEANLAIAAKGPLQAQTVSAIREAFRNADPNGSWTGQT